MSNVLKIPDNDDFHERRSDARRIAPYLLRFYASISNPNALALSEKIIELLVGQIVWPRGATARVSALLKRQDRSLRSRNLSQHDWLDPSNRQDNTCVDACEPPSNPVDKKLAQFGSFQVGFRLLFADEPSWLRGVLRDSVSTAESLQNESDGTKWRRLQDIGEVFQWTSTELKLARIAMHADDVSEFAEWLDDLPNVSRDAAKTYARVLGANANAVRESSQRRSALMSCGLCCIERNEESSRGFAAPPRLHQKLLSILAMDDFDVGQLPLFLFSKSPQPTLVKTDVAHLKGEMTSLELLLRRATTCASAASTSSSMVHREPAKPSSRVSSSQVPNLTRLRCPQLTAKVRMAPRTRSATAWRCCGVRIGYCKARRKRYSSSMRRKMRSRRNRRHGLAAGANTAYGKAREKRGLISCWRRRRYRQSGLATRCIRWMRHLCVDSPTTLKCVALRSVCARESRCNVPLRIECLRVSLNRSALTLTRVQQRSTAR